MNNGFVRKEIIPDGHYRLEVLSAETNNTYSPQVSARVRVVGGEYNGHTFVDYSSRSEDTGEIQQGTKAWSLIESCLGDGFDKKVSSVEGALQMLPGHQFLSQISATKTGTRNRLEHGTIGPVQTEEDSVGLGNGSSPEPPDEGTGWEDITF